MRIKNYLENKPLKRREAPDSSFAVVRAHQLSITDELTIS